jgi:hypothetical protein
MTLHDILSLQKKPNKKEAMNAKQQRNELCSCGSGKKYKKCCGLKDAKEAQSRNTLLRGMNQGTAAAYKDLSKSLFKVLKTGIPGIPTIPTNAQNHDYNPEEAPFELLPPPEKTDDSKSLS